MSQKKDERGPLSINSFKYLVADATLFDFIYFLFHRVVWLRVHLTYIILLGVCVVDVS